MSKSSVGRGRLNGSEHLIRQFDDGAVAPAMAEFENKLEETPLAIACLECDSDVTLTREDLYWKDSSDLREDMAEARCPECGHLNHYYHVKILLDLGVLGQ